MLPNICRAPQRLELAIGAQVILVKTIDASVGLVNGSRGVVIRFLPKTQQPIVRFDNDKNKELYIERVILPETWCVKGGTSGHSVIASRKQLPLDLAW